MSNIQTIKSEYLTYNTEFTRVKFNFNFNSGKYEPDINGLYVKYGEFGWAWVRWGQVSDIELDHPKYIWTSRFKQVFLIKEDFAMLSFYEVKKLEIAKKLLEEVSDSEGFKTIDYHPDLHLGDALQAIDELLLEYYPEGYTPPETNSENLYSFRLWHEKRSDRISFGFSELITTSLMVAMLSGAFGGNKVHPDFAAHSKMYRGLEDF